VPGEQEEDYKITEGYLHRLENVDLHIGLMKVFPGTILERQLIKKGNLDPELWLDENGPQVVSAVNGDAFVKASEQWQHLLDAFPSSREHNKIDQELFHLNFFEPENCGR